MEAFPERSPTHRGQIPPDRQLPSSKNKVERIGRQTKGLFEDFTQWVELRLRLFQLDVQDKIQKKANEAIIKIAPFVVGALGGLFLLVTAALFIGWWLGHPAWGFLVVTGLLFLVAGVLYARSKRLDAEKDHDVDWSRSNGAAEDRESTAA